MELLIKYYDESGMAASNFSFLQRKLV